MIDRSGRGGVGPTNAGGKPMSRAYPAPAKKKSAISALAGALADAAFDPRTPSKLAGAGISGVVSTLKRASKAVTGNNPYKK